MKTLSPITTRTTESTAPDDGGPRLLDVQSSRTVARGWLWFWAPLVTLAYALLWSPNWYPLSDSSLYLSLGRSFSAGRGLTMMGDAVKLTPPLAPLLIAAIIKLGGGMGTIQAVMTGLILLSHAFCFLALRRIVGERLALAATLGGALSYWVYANAFTVMSEPPSMALMWAGVWVLTGVRPAVETGGRAQWGRVLGACLLLLGAAAARDAVVALTPGFLLLLPGATRPGLKLGAILAALGVSAIGAWVMWQAKRGKLPAWSWSAAILIPIGIVLVTWGYRRRDRFERVLDRLRVPLARPEAWGYLAMFAVIMGGWLLVYRYPPKLLTGTAYVRATTGPTTMFAPGTTQPITVMPTGPITVAEGDEDVSREGRYKATWLYGVKRDAKHLLTEPPVLGGRWVVEGLVMPAVAVFDTKNKALGAVGITIALTALILSIVGLVMMLRAGHWWLLGAVVYFLAIWLQWGTRIKPRYMIPIAPVLFMLLWAGLVTLVSWGRVWRAGTSTAPGRAARPADTRLGWALATALVAMVALGNAFPWWVEFRVRHPRDGRDFYDVARRGAFSELVDIGAWAQQNVGPHETIWMNAGAQRRIAYFLTGRRIETREVRARTWAEFASLPGQSEKFTKPLRNFRRTIPPQDRFMIAYVEQPQKGVTWPGWHWPLAPWEQRPNWWKLYTRTPDGQWAEIRVPRADRSFVSRVPVAGM
jgi:hypothetical protein